MASSFTRVLGKCCSAPFTLGRVQVRHMSRKRRKPKRVLQRMQKADDEFARDLRIFAEEVEKDPEFQAFKKAMDEKLGDTGPIPVNEAAMHESRSHPSALYDRIAKTGRIIPVSVDEEEKGPTVTSDENKPKNDTSSSTVFKSREHERELVIQSRRRSREGTDFGSILEEYFSSHRAGDIRVHPKGSKKSFGLNAVCIDVVNVATVSKSMYVVTWYISDLMQEMADVGGMLTQADDESAFRDYLKSDHYDKDALIEAVSQALKKSIGRIRFHVGKVAQMRKIPELRFKAYNVEDHMERISIAEQIRRLPKGELDPKVKGFTGKDDPLEWKLVSSKF
uniref:Uncharacterized protein n=1 Tax=Lotharella oceanica TaxID=641309 RepID=A0A7S2TTZ7_9EUKA